LILFVTIYSCDHFARWKSESRASSQQHCLYGAQASSWIGQDFLSGCYCPFPTFVHTWRHEDKKLRYPFPTLVRTWRLQEQDASTLFSTLVRTPRVWIILTTIVQRLELLVSSWLLNTL
jgi:hypothetical protein